MAPISSLMRIAILYGSPTKLTNAHKLVSHIAGPMAHGAHRQPKYFVRMETMNIKGDLADALDLAKPMDGEVVLNTVSL